MLIQINGSTRAFEDELEQFESIAWLNRASSAYTATFEAGVQPFTILTKQADALKLAEIRIRREAKKQFVELYTDYWTEVIIHFARWSEGELTNRAAPDYETRNLNQWRKAARRFIKRHAGKAIVGITLSTLRTFRRIVKIGVDAGEGTEVLARRLARESIAFGRRRSTLWVKTELVAASNFGAMEGARTSGVPLDKQWITSVDGRERDSHRHTNNQIRPLDVPFDVRDTNLVPDKIGVGDGEKLMQPGDPTASLRNRINCRCAVAFIPLDE